LRIARDELRMARMKYLLHLSDCQHNDETMNTQPQPTRNDILPPQVEHLTNICRTIPS
jgi:hypothetical protein